MGNMIFAFPRKPYTYMQKQVITTKKKFKINAQ